MPQAVGDNTVANVYPHATAYASAGAISPNFYYNGMQPYPVSPPIHQYFSFMQNAKCPPEILMAAENVINYLSTSPLNLGPVLASMQNLQQLSPEDRLVGLLLRIQKQLPVHCQARADISKLILYNMMRSYLNYVPILEGAIPDNFGIFHPTGENVVNYREIIKHLLNKLRCCEKKSAMRSAPPAAPPKVEIRYMEKPTTAPQIITEIKYVDKPCPTLPPTSPPTTESPYKKFVSVIPNPSNGFEKMKYETLTTFLQREDLSSLIGTLDFSASLNDQERLNLILSKSAGLQLEKPVVDAIKYYLSSSRRMSSLNLYTQKEIRKHFELTQIFTDTLDFENLSTEGKLAFDAFYNFLLEVNGDQMKGFDTWSEVTTRGEFMHVLFDYFLVQTFVPENIKEAMTFLKPLIKMDGPAANPP